MKIYKVLFHFEQGRVAFCVISSEDIFGAYKIAEKDIRGKMLCGKIALGKLLKYEVDTYWDDEDSILF